MLLCLILIFCIDSFASFRFPATTVPFYLTQGLLSIMSDVEHVDCYSQACIFQRFASHDLAFPYVKWKFWTYFYAFFFDTFFSVYMYECFVKFALFTLFPLHFFENSHVHLGVPLLHKQSQFCFNLLLHSTCSYLTGSSELGRVRSRMQNQENTHEYLPQQWFLQLCHRARSEKCGKAPGTFHGHTYQVFGEFVYYFNF